MTIDENILHGTGRGIGRRGGRIILQIKKKAELAGSLKVYIYLIMDAQLNIQNGVFFCIRKTLRITEPDMALFVAMTGV